MRFKVIIGLDSFGKKLPLIILSNQFKKKSPYKQLKNNKLI